MIVDASVWVSSLVLQDANHQASHRWLQSQTASEAQLVVPSIALPEVAGAIARRENSAEAGHEAAQWMVRLAGIQIVSLHAALGSHAAWVSAKYRLRGAGAMYVAVADELGLPLVTWDRELLHRAASIVDVIQL